VIDVVGVGCEPQAVAATTKRAPTATIRSNRLLIGCDFTDSSHACARRVGRRVSPNCL
jgi:hypothetical protein